MINLKRLIESKGAEHERLLSDLGRYWTKEEAALLVK